MILRQMQRTIVIGIAFSFLPCFYVHAGEQPRIEELISRTPQLSSSNRNLKAFSLSIVSEGIVADIRWYRGKTSSVLLEDETTHSPIVLHAEAKLLVNDPANKTVWISNMQGFELNLSSTNEGGYELKLGADDSHDNDESLHIDIQSFLRFKPKKIEKVEGEEDVITVHLEVGSPGKQLVATFKTGKTNPLVSLERCSAERPFGAFTISEIRLGNEALKPYSMPDLDSVRAVSAVNSSIENIANAQNVASESISFLVQQTDAFRRLIPIRLGLIDPSLRPSSELSEDIMWEEIMAIDRRVSPKIRKVILEAQ